MQVSSLSKTKVYPEFAREALHAPREGAEFTAAEILQQPALWGELAAAYEQVSATIAAFLAPLLARENLRVLLCGAGTSAYIGEALAAHVAKQLPLAGQSAEALATTDLVSHPHLHLDPARPTLVLSFGRSGSSPESMAAIDICDALLPECYHLLVTCNPEGKMAAYARQQQTRCCLWLMPEASHDRSFAMTSSFSCMYLAVLLLFCRDDKALARVVAMANALLDERLSEIAAQALEDNTRLVYLGGGALKGVAREAALKLLELSAGRVIGLYETPLGFRHGPKSLVDGQTRIVLLASSEPYARAYDLDMVRELEGDEQARGVTMLCEERLTADGQRLLDEVWLGLPYVLYCQLLAYYTALNLAVSPDNPCPGGQVNRVVQGVNVHSLDLYRAPL
ncbi:SIS domain-containing protein [Shewanella cyperi]|uniref:SIS domain-containing protein n=1 Tax=Shewanella cyperi TaxID=2814292 RepID=UPI001A93D0CB|nr:SIS domain-containing protein [Shewanella cyperi]QSX41989.1 SIS domain-containing protein [Shewanella cyperi]